MKKDHTSSGNLLQTVMTLGLGFILNGQTLQMLPSVCMSASPVTMMRRKKVGLCPYAVATEYTSCRILQDGDVPFSSGIFTERPVSHEEGSEHEFL